MGELIDGWKFILIKKKRNRQIIKGETNNYIQFIPCTRNKYKIKFYS